MCQQQPRRRALVALALGLLGHAEAGFPGFNVPNINPGQITAPFSGQSPADIAQAVKSSAEDHMKKVQDSSPVKDAQKLVDQAAAHDFSGAFESMTGQRPENVTAVVTDSLEQRKNDLSKALDHASDALKRGSDAVGDVTQSTVNSAVAAIDANGAIKQVEEAAKAADPGTVADTIRTNAAGVVDKINSTSQNLANDIKQQVPKASAFLNRTATEIAERIHPTDAPAGDTLAALGIDTAAARKYGPLSGVLCLVAAVSAGYLVTKRFTGGQRSPMLLSDALEGVTSHGRSSRTPVLQMSHSQEPYAQF